MQEQLKERLTGAAILVVVVVLAVPEMFRGRPDAVAPSGPQEGSATPLRTWTLVDGDAGATPPAATPAPAGDQGPPGGPPTGQPISQASGSGSGQAPGGAAPVGAPAPAPAAVPPVVAQPAQAQPVAPAAAATAPPRSASPAASQQETSTAARSSGWAVQVGSFHARELAERMVRDVHAKGFKVHVVGPDARGLYRVRSALLADKAAALALKQQMVARGLKPIVNASP